MCNLPEQKSQAFIRFPNGLVPVEGRNHYSKVPMTTHPFSASTAAVDYMGKTEGLMSEPERRS